MFATKEIISISKLCWCTTLVLLWCSTFNAHAKGIEYSANGLKIELSEEVQAAIDNGVSLTFKCEFAHRNRFLFITWTEQLKQHQFVVTRHALSNRYLVRYGNKLAPRMFSSTRETMAFIAEQSLALFLKYLSNDSHGEPVYKMRLRLSKVELPAPMRLNAFIAGEWNLDSGWTSWKSAL